MSRKQKEFKLPKTLERHLATLAKLYSHEGKKDREELLVNAHMRVEEGWSFDNWNGGTHGHALHLVLPEELYLSVTRQKEKLQKEIAADLNELHNVPNEFIEEVFFEVEARSDEDWRVESGLLRAKNHVPSATAKRIWGESGYRVFLSHKAEVKLKAARLKEKLKPFGVSAFVAHADIKATKKWQDEIESALSSMGAFCCDHDG